MSIHELVKQPQERAHTPSPARARLSRQKCACGGTPGPDGECAACKAKRLARERREGTSMPNQKQASPGHSFSRMPVNASRRYQAKLSVSQPGDVFEREAEQMADQVVQRACVGCDEGKLHRKTAGEDGKPGLQGKEASSAGLEISPEIEAQVENARRGGELLPHRTRSFFESQFGQDFSQVRVHTDRQAAQSAAAVNALAYTVQRDIVFGAGQYAPETTTGKRLLAHELTHVVQQGAAGQSGKNSAKSASRTLQRQGGGAAAAPPARVCGPDVTRQFRDTLRNIETTYGRWSRPNRLRACARVLVPVTPSGAPDINGWDTLPLFQGNSAWLRTPPVYRRRQRGPCATPTTRDPAHNGDPFAAGHEHPDTCSNSVQFDGQCWLNGTVNYGTFGVMVRLCAGDFTLADLARSQGYSIGRLVQAQARRAGADRETAGILGEVAGALGEAAAELFNPSLQTWAEILIRGYKAAKGSPTDTSDLPIAWVRAFSAGGSAAAAPSGANRPTCASTCRLTGALANPWRWVWEPVMPRR